MAVSPSNLLLGSFSPSDRKAVLSHCTELDLPNRTPLEVQEQSPRYLYFLTAGVASVVVTHQGGACSETLLVGREGLTSAVSLLGSSSSPADCFIQVPGSGWRIPYRAIRKLFAESPSIRARILECVQQQSMTTTQIAACNIAHEAEPRLARWLLMVGDRTGEETFQLTQEFLAQMLGARRTTVVAVAGSLQRSGFIEYSRGKVTILSREKLETAACSCYAVTKRLLTKLYRQPASPRRIPSHHEPSQAIPSLTGGH